MIWFLATGRQLRRANANLRRELAWLREQARIDQAELTALRRLLADAAEPATAPRRRHAAAGPPVPDRRLRGAVEAGGWPPPGDPADAPTEFLDLPGLRPGHD